MKRRQFLSGAAVVGATAAAASTFAKPAIAQDKREWRMVTTWPKNYPGLGTGAELLAKYITEASEGRLTVKVFGAGEIVPAFESIEAVGTGAVEMGHGAPYYWKGKVPATEFIASMPFGLTAQEQNAWFYYFGGQELADKAYAELNCKFFASGNTAATMGGWYNKEINSIADFNGLKIRIPGLGGEVLKAAGSNVVNLPGGELAPALQTGSIDAVDWVGPYNDLAFGLYKSAKYYVHPGWYEPATVLDNFINLDAWNELPADLKAIVEAANKAVNVMVMSEFTARNNDALKTLIEKHNVQLKRLSDDTIKGLGKLTGEVLSDVAARDPLAKEVFDSLIKFRTQSVAWSKISEGGFMEARAMDYAFPTS
ncbi:MULTISPECIES: TRAP transporter substrate-binding protein [Thalassospira]|jgi:TRAP-type mannitol/chloroaromatic compound transport system substrate-binding protein|uniref:ABC transporter substrate-binding protein n=2 Tax=Thalassospira TaxID=168934 RepID=A0A367W7B8_9PROT|nr:MULTISPECIES: TRAP transporter substrate-binding protein [Thalassospira]MDG4719629.1 TRAP transporter substrate-binding protein [Thalassospira sp. FZY0004]RCK36330.1 ABC transporter substrate-binding protein [Thalassospira profundimaris]